ncbi:Nucleotide-diphospho-sugar transferase [Parasponia andersonii]|uniref:Nucleotide-diphospho-sugar transferase n=1 Tax=Parasponia andersonii TaxID=3476 RepID=A0A2P5CCT7_PARAD|nr:Nucleotide-diphospho-sugar transferase [Parasponia andersonii]
MAAILYLSVSSSSNITSQLFSLKPGVLKCPVTNLNTREAPLDELEAALAKASMENKTVIIAVINKAYADEEIGGDSTMLDLFLRSFWLGEDTRPLLNHLLLVAVDQTAHERCQFLKLNCYKLETDGVDFTEEKLYMSPGFLKMMWRRTWFLLEVLKRGYSFIFTVSFLSMQKSFPK